MVTIRDIAKKSNVTPGTVSMVLNGRGRLSAETRSRVEAVIAEMGYKQKSVGRPRRVPQRATTTLAVVYAQRVARGGVLSQLSQAWIGGIREAAIESHCHLNLIGALQDGTQDHMFRHSLENNDVDGVIFIGITAEDGQAYLNQAVARGVPTVVMNRIPVHSEFSYVSMDNFGSGQRAIDFLVRRGHRRIGLIHLASTDRYAVDRKAGAEAALASHDLIASATEALPHDSSPEQLLQVCESIVKANSTAVYLTAGDVPTARCIDTFQLMGIRVPEDVSLIGWDDIGVLSQSGLRPTSVGYDKHAMGKEAAYMLLDLMKRGADVRSRGLVVPTRVVEYDTTTEFSEKSAEKARA